MYELQQVQGMLERNEGGEMLGCKRFMGYKLKPEFIGSELCFGCDKVEECKKDMGIPPKLKSTYKNTKEVRL